MFLTKEKFIKLFPCQPDPNTTERELAKQVIVTYKNNPNLLDVIEKKFTKKEVKQILTYYHKLLITERDHALGSFFEAYFKITKTDSLKKNVDLWVDKRKPITFKKSKNVKDKVSKLLSDKSNFPVVSIQKNDTTRRIIRNLNWDHILHFTQIMNTVKSHVSFWQTLENAFCKYIIEDRLLAPSSVKLYINQKSKKSEFNTFFYLIQQYQPKASIINPYFIVWSLKEFFNNINNPASQGLINAKQGLINAKQGAALFTPTLSWCSPLLSFCFSDWKKYVGIDVIPEVCKRCEFLFDTYGQDDQSIDIYCKPSESFINNKAFLEKYTNYFDAIIFSPPYYMMELYKDSDKTQSTTKYPDYKIWLKDYLEVTIQLCHKVLKSKKRIGILINNYNDLKGKEYHLIEDSIAIVLKYFKMVNMIKLVNRTSPLRMNKKTRTEFLILFEK